MSTAESSPGLALEIGDACELAAAWISGVGEARGIRLIVIKGQSLAHHGLRPTRTSADVDVLVDPLRFDEMCLAVSRAGWRRRPGTEVGGIWAPHSQTYLHDSWPCDLDIHRFFPGFLAEPETTFNLLWESRDDMQLAHRTVPIPSRSASILVSGLHQFRDGKTRADKVELSNVAAANLSDADRRDLIALAEATHAIEPARELLYRLGIAESELPRLQDSARLREWRARIDANGSGAFFWMLLLERTPPRDRISLLRRALWPPRETLMIDHPGARDTVAGRTALRLSRIPPAVRGLPDAMRAMFRRRRRASGATPR